MSEYFEYRGEIYRRDAIIRVSQNGYGEAYIHLVDGKTDHIPIENTYREIKKILMGDDCDD